MGESYGDQLEKREDRSSLRGFFSCIFVRGVSCINVHTYAKSLNYILKICLLSNV